MRWLFIPFFLTACASVDPWAIRQLATLDPLTADPSGFAVSVDLPSGLGIQPGSVVLSLQARSKGDRESGGRWNLDGTVDADGRTSYQLAQNDLASFRALQETVAAWKAKHPEATKGSLSLSVTPCRATARPLATDARFSAYLTLEEGGATLPILQDVPVQDFLADTNVRDLPGCTSRTEANL